MMCIRIPTKGCRQLASTVDKQKHRIIIVGDVGKSLSSWPGRTGCNSEGGWGRRKEIHVQIDGQEIVGLVLENRMDTMEL